MPKRCEVLTAEELRRELERRVEEAGSQRSLADGDQSLQAMISWTVRKKKPVTMPRILDLLGYVMVFRKRSEPNLKLKQKGRAAWVEWLNSDDVMHG